MRLGHGYQRESCVGAFSFDGRIVTVVLLSCFGLVDMLHGYSDKRLGQREVGFGFGIGLLLRFCYVGCTKVSRGKRRRSRGAVHTRSHVDRSEDSVPVGENSCDGCKSQYG